MAHRPAHRPFWRSFWPPRERRPVVHTLCTTLLFLLIAWLGAQAYMSIAAATAPLPPYLTYNLQESVRSPSTVINAHALAAGVAKTETVPTLTGVSGARVIAIFRGDCPSYYFHVAGTTAAEPVGDITDGTASAGNPSAYNLGEGEAYTLISPTGCHVTIEYYPHRR